MLTVFNHLSTDFVCPLERGDFRWFFTTSKRAPNPVTNSGIISRLGGNAKLKTRPKGSHILAAYGQRKTSISREGREVSEGGEGEEGSSSLADYTGQGPKKLTRSNFSAKGALHTSLGQRPKLEVEKTVEG